MLWFFILIPTTAIVAGGYIVLVFSGKTEGALKTFGKYLAIWIFVLAGLYFAGATTAAMYRGAHPHAMMHGPGMMDRPMMERDGMRGGMRDGMMGGMRGGMRGGMMRRNQPAPEPPPETAPGGEVNP